MSKKEESKPGDGLRKLALMVVKDRVAGEALINYLRFILEDRLVELDAHARLWTKATASRFENLAPAEVSIALVNRADELDAAGRSK